MKRFASLVLGCFVLFCLMVATEQKAFAYVDPGSGLLVIQSAAAAVGSIAYFCRRKLKALFGGKAGDTVDVSEEKKPGTQKVA